MGPVDAVSGVLGVHVLFKRAIGDDFSTDGNAELAFPVVATFVVFARLYLRRKSSINLKWDDYTLAVSLPFTWSVWALWYYICNHAAPGSDAFSDPDKARTYYILFFAIAALWSIGIFFVKLAVLLFFLRAFGTQRVVRIIIYAQLAFNIGYSTTQLFSTIFSCRSQPIHTIWDDPAHCHSSRLSFQVLQCLNLVSELILLILPIPIVWRLRVPLRTRLAISAVFLFGATTCTTTAVRIWVTVRYLHQQHDVGGIRGVAILMVCLLGEMAGGTVTVSLAGIREPLQSALQSLLKKFKKEERTSVTCVSDLEVGALESKMSMNVEVKELVATSP